MALVSDGALVEQLKAKLRSLEDQINLLNKQRQAAIEMIESLNGQAFKTPRARKVKPSGNKRQQIVEAVIELAKRHQRPVTTEEILSYVKESGLQIGNNHARQRAFLGAVLSHESKDENKEKSPIVRIDRGVYDVKK